MSEKKELNQEELKEVSGGGRDGRDGGAIYNIPDSEPETTNQTDFNAIYGVETTKK